jgi:hypothetical protein
MQVQKRDSADDVAYATMAESAPQTEAQTALATDTGLDVYA